MALNTHQQKLKQSLISAGEEWTPSFENILKLDPDYFQAYVKLKQVPKANQTLSTKTQELLLLAMDAAVTHLDGHGVKVHTVAAMRAGASAEECMEALELSSTIGVHAVTVGVPILMEVLREIGTDLPSDDLNDKQQQLKQSFTEKRGYWSSLWDPVLRLSPAFFEAYLEYSSVPFSEGHNHLDNKTKELIYTAIDCSTTHMYQPGLKIHIQNAVKYGATPQEIMEVFALAALMGVKTSLIGADAIVDYMDGRK